MMTKTCGQLGHVIVNAHSFVVWYRPHASFFYVPPERPEGKDSFLCVLKIRKTFRPNSTTLKGVRVLPPSDNAPSSEEEEEEAEDVTDPDAWRIERVEDVRRGKRRQLELYVKWSGLDENGEREVC